MELLSSSSIVFPDPCLKKELKLFSLKFASSCLPKTTLSLQLNPNGKPSRGSYEIYVQKSSKDDKVNIWSGLKKGPPRKDKFPEVASLMDQIKKALL